MKLRCQYELQTVVWQTTHAVTTTTALTPWTMCHAVQRANGAPDPQIPKLSCTKCFKSVPTAACQARCESVVVEGVHLSLNAVMRLMAKHDAIVPFLIHIRFCLLRQLSAAYSTVPTCLTAPYDASATSSSASSILCSH